MALANTLYRQVTPTPTTRQHIDHETNADFLQEPLLHQLPDARYRFHCWFRLGDWLNNVMDKVWDNNNRGRQWKDIRHKFLEGGDEDEE